MRLVQFFTILLIALAVVPGGAHVLELLNKIGLERDAYVAVQSIYQGWSMMGIVIVAALIASLILAILSRRQANSFFLAFAAFLLLAAGLAIFFAWTFPVNQATSNWTVAPDDWAKLREQWEYSHTVNAGLTFLALCCATGSSLLWRTDKTPA